MNTEVIEVEPEVQVPIEGAPLRISTRDFDDAAEKLGLDTLNAEQTKALQTVGMFMEQMGAIQVANGRYMVRATEIQHWLDILKKIAGDTADSQLRVNCAIAAGKILDKLLENDKIATRLIELRVSNTPQGQARPRNRSFSPGEAVTPSVAVQVNVNGEKVVTDAPK